ncbi:LytTR family DNA-binding domain-containing protein [Jiulongibacter sediminis]|jgi:two-component system LytT family response regulator|nr:LytTR family DNA-binding domain-containing protein [Jiulongibacter sediminis]
MKNESKNFSKISLPTAKGYIFFDIDQIMWCEAQGNYSQIKIKTGEEYLASKNLKSLHETLDDPRFIRSHNSFIVNKYYVKSFVKADGGYLEMEDGKAVSVSRTRKEQVLRDLF